MKSSILSFFLLLLATHNSCSQEKNTKELNFKNAIEYSIENCSNNINPIIKKINTLLNEGDIDSLSMIEYYNCKNTLKAEIKFINDLSEVDNEIKLKESTIKYFETVDKILDNFILPVITHLNNPNQSEIFDAEKLKQGILLMEKSVTETSELSNNLDMFCAKYKLSRRMSEFEKKELTQKIENLKSELKN
ncbi:hypothetical protein [Flavobacterium macrobrachii]|uniref:Uncharacterized protein n=1 Tax=Flavobacterium macrobrachii TaxID=591204 RepID=A0ABS2CSI4_9FLAO|nr:hypothetical protein [Flavobacterium macrobrachii]MBM6497915.1 hypothetical protein [Flavobacterium macrobrachii]